MCILMDPETRPCGGHGTCSPANICVCDAGWSSIGDLSFDPANECSLFTPAIQAEWVLFFVVMSFAVAGSMWSLAKRFRAGKLTQESMHHWIIFFMAIFEGCMFLPLAVMKILDPPHYAVGLHVGVTVLYCFGGAAAWTMLFFAVHWIMKTANMQIRQKLHASKRHSADAFFRRMVVVTTLLGAANVVWCFVPLALLSDPSASTIFVVAALHALGLGFSMLVMYFMTVLIAEIEASVDATVKMRGGVRDPQLTAVVVKLRHARVQAALNGFGQFALTFPFGLWPFMIQKLSYQFPLAWTVSALAACLIVWISNTSNSGAQSTQSGNKVATNPSSTEQSAVSPRAAEAAEDVT